MRYYSRNHYVSSTNPTRLLSLPTIQFCAISQFRSPELKYVCSKWKESNSLKGYCQNADLARKWRKLFVLKGINPKFFFCIVFRYEKDDTNIISRHYTLEQCS
ncbi:hypothetical protein TNIN_325411 [Trichonephila inaurata madagascariensis]|uniref:Uncharacterized protein n=1 Tax=Trichonephila inaurata madagascariensis TaxID=2747483 RepID=A0A8X6YZT8_9ARAC|nr:hypothetical protein TNIN_325411 [Trichonephila inaurata madagascariensis]